MEANFWPEENVVDPDETFNIIIELKNKSQFPIYFIKVNATFPKEFEVDSNVKLASKKYGNDDRTVSFSTWLKAKQTIKLKIPVLISTRGRYVLQNPTLFFGDFLGLKETRKEIALFREVVVAPKTYETEEVKQEGNLPYPTRKIKDKQGSQKESLPLFYDFSLNHKSVSENILSLYLILPEANEEASQE